MWPTSLTLWALSAACLCLADNLEYMNTVELLNAFGCPAEIHELVTQDGYILNMQRMKPKVSNDRPPVLLQHGMLGVSDTWVLMGPRRDLAFLLWEDGYDVWISNIRGTPYSLKHVNKTKADRSYWEFSFHEMGYYDVPAMIDYILITTQHKDLYYIGHSMGTTMFYVMCATRPEYNKKIRAMFSLAPVAYMSNMIDFYKQLSKYRRQIYKSFISGGLYEVFPRVEWMRRVMANMCRDGSPTQSLCLMTVFLICGYDNIQLNKTLLPMVFTHFASTSANTVMHYAQHIESGGFQWYDHGKRKNLKIYGSRKPPSYNLALVTAPIVLHYSRNDLLSMEKDVNRLASRLPNLIGKFLVPFKYFNHIDYMWSKDVKKLLYNDIINMMGKI